MDGRMSYRRFPAVIGAAIFACLASPVLAIDGPARVVDGDTIVIFRERIRIQNFNAPELNELGGLAAKARMEALTRGKSVHCEGKARDRYGRLVARCDVDGVDLGRAMRPLL